MIRALGWNAYLAFHILGQKTVPFMSRDQLRRRQSRRVRQMVRYAYRYGRGCHVLLNCRLGDPANRVPEPCPCGRTLPLIAVPLGRAEQIIAPRVRDNPAAFRSKLYEPQACVVSHSVGGGATAWDPGSALMELAYAERDRAVWLKVGRLGLGHRQLHILSSGSSTLTVRAFWDQQVKTPRLVAQRHFVDPLEPYEKVVEALDRVRPDIAFSYGSYLEQFTRFLRGEIVVSNLVNRATVLLNYRLGDLTESSREGCPCGRTLPLMRRFHGRVSETVQTADGVRLSSTVLLGEFAGEVESALKVQVFSPEARRILWRIVPARELDRERFRLRLLARCREVFTGAAVEVQYVEDIAATPAGKFRSVIHSTERGL